MLTSFRSPSPRKPHSLSAAILVAVLAAERLPAEAPPSPAARAVSTRPTTTLPPDSTRALRDQLGKLRAYVLEAVEPSGLVRDSLPTSPRAAAYHPASPDAAGFAVVAMCALEHVGLLPDAAARIADVLAACAGERSGVTPARSAEGYWLHFMDVRTGQYPGGSWERVYTPIGSALLVSAAQFARNHFAGDDRLARLAEALTRSIDFDAAIDPSLDGGVYLGMAESGGGDPGLSRARPWNEFMLVVSLARRQADSKRAGHIAPLWLDPARLPTIRYRNVETLTDQAARFAPAFWVQQMHFFNADFATNERFERYLRDQQRADSLYCSLELGEARAYGLSAGVNPDGYHADRIDDHHRVFSPETVAGWGDLEGAIRMCREQLASDDPRYRYGLLRFAPRAPEWVPPDTGLVDHLYLLFGIVERMEPLFFFQRLAGQADSDGNGLADRYEQRTPAPGTSR